MDLEVVGRHVLLFDDDTMAAFVNSGDALVEWHSLQIDRYDVRHLLSAPPPPRRRNRNSEPLQLEDLSLESQLDHERYLDLPTHSDQPDIEEAEHRSDAIGYRAVAFSYGSTDDPTEQKNTDAGMESSGFLPRFSIPENLLHCLPPTEKVHQIIARTAMFVSKHGGQSEIILRVKQGDNPTFGFLMPGHHLHSYFRFLVDHPKLLHSESDGNSDEQKKTGSEHNDSNGVGGALSLLGSVYGSGEEEEGDDTAKTEKDVSQDSTYSVNHSIYHGSKKIESQGDATKDESVSRNPILSNKEKVLTVKKNALITAPKSGTVKGIEEKSRSLAAADKAKSPTMGMTSKNEPLILEPPPELKRLIDRLVEFIMRNGKQFEETLIEQDRKHGKFPFLLPSNQYHSYYLKVLQTAPELKLNGKSFYSGKDDLLGHGMGSNASMLKEKDGSAVCDMPLESDRKEKFKMVIGKSKREAQETESKGTQQECGITVDAAAAAAILQAATRGIKNSNLPIISSASRSAYVHVNSSEGGQVSVLPSLPDNGVEKSGQSDSRNVSAVAPTTIASEVAGEADSSEAHLTKEQKLKAERLKRAKMFVAMLKSGEVPFKSGTSRASSLEPPVSGVSRSAGEINHDGKERESSLAPAVVDRPGTSEKPERNYFGDEHTARLSKRKYRSRSGGCEVDDEEDDGIDIKDHNERRSKRNFRSRSRRHDEDDENENAVEMEQKKQHRRRHCTHSSSEENEGERESSEEDGDHKNYKLKHWSHHSDKDDEQEDEHEEDKNHKRSRKKHRSHRSSREHSRKRRLSKKYLQEEDEHDDHGRDKKQSRKKHRSHHSSHRSRDKHRHRSSRSSRDEKTRGNPNHDTSSDDEHQSDSCMDKHKKELPDERDDLEEGEISSRVSEESRGMASGHISRETSVDVGGCHQRASSQPSDTTPEVPDDLRAKIRAMLMATRL